MPNKPWKDTERRLAALFGTERRACSGGNSKSGGRDDVKHPELFIECKHGKQIAPWSLYLETRKLASKEDKIPLLGLHQSGYPGFLLVIHSSNSLELFRHLHPENFKETEASKLSTKKPPKPIRKTVRQ